MIHYFTITWQHRNKGWLERAESRVGFRVVESASSILLRLERAPFWGGEDGSGEDTSSWLCCLCSQLITGSSSSAPECYSLWVRCFFRLLDAELVKSCVRGANLFFGCIFVIGCLVPFVFSAVPWYGGWGRQIPTSRNTDFRALGSACHSFYNCSLGFAPRGLQQGIIFLTGCSDFMEKCCHSHMVHSLPYLLLSHGPLFPAQQFFDWSSETHPW